MFATNRNTKGDIFLEKELSQVLLRTENFVAEGCRAVIKQSAAVPERFLISPCPVSTALACMSLMLNFRQNSAQIKKALDYLEISRNPDGGWGRTPGSPSDAKATEICQAAIACKKRGVTPAAIRLASANISATWMQDVPRLVLDWPEDSPLLKIMEKFLLNGSSGGVFPDIALDHLPALSVFLPPAGRPLVIALACIKESGSSKNSRVIPANLKKLTAYQSPNGAWCDDILITSLAILCLYLRRGDNSTRAKGLKWLASVQYSSGAWPSFNQLTNWAVGLSGYIFHCYHLESPNLVEECRRFLTGSANHDSSYGTRGPYSFPDVDDTAVALLGLTAGSDQTGMIADQAARARHVLLSLQNKDGSWGTFPEVAGLPPDCRSNHPVHIKSVDVTLHALEALINCGLGPDSSPVRRGLWWLAYHQKNNGSWKSTWYLGNTYATAQALALLAQQNLWPKSRLRAETWLIKAQKANGSWPSGSAGEGGLAVAALLKNKLDPQAGPIQKGLSYLSSIQQPDGSFRPAYAGLYASGLYYEEPISEALAVIRAIKSYEAAVN